MPHYKLTYLNMMGRAEHIRLIFAQAGVEYDDNRLTQEEWAAFKSKTPFGQIPVLEVDGKMLAQTGAITTYLAKQFGLNGKDDWEAAKIQQLNGGIEDLIVQVIPWFREQDPEKKKELADKLVADHVTPWLQRYEKFLTDNGTGYFVGNSVTQIDLGLLQFMGLFSHVLCPETFKKFPELCKFMERIASLPNIAAWIQKRPKTDH
uniref:glutathione transferase n=1 Tax=Plectus sambesii TaxID=2011161 RepID=A0A914VBI2_9BILA